MKLIFILCFCFLTVGAFAQENSNTTSTENTASSPHRLVRRIMPQVQLIYSNYQSDATTNYINKQGWGAGALFDFGTAQHLVLESGLLYRELNGGFQNTYGSTTYTFDYLSLPVAAKVYFSGQENTSFYLKAGAMASTQTASNVVYSPGYAGSAQSVNGRAWEFAGLGGAGMKFVLTPQSDIFIEADYSRPTDILFTTATGYNAAWNLGAGFGLNL